MIFYCCQLRVVKLLPELLYRVDRSHWSAVILLSLLTPAPAPEEINSSREKSSLAVTSEASRM